MLDIRNWGRMVTYNFTRFWRRYRGADGGWASNRFVSAGVGSGLGDWSAAGRLRTSTLTAACGGASLMKSVDRCGRSGVAGGGVGWMWMPGGGCMNSPKAMRSCWGLNSWRLYHSFVCRSSVRHRWERSNETSLGLIPGQLRQIFGRSARQNSRKALGGRFCGSGVRGFFGRPGPGNMAGVRQRSELNAVREFEGACVSSVSKQATLHRNKHLNCRSIQGIVFLIELFLSVRCAKGSLRMQWGFGVLYSQILKVSPDRPPAPQSIIDSHQT